MHRCISGCFSVRVFASLSKRNYDSAYDTQTCFCDFGAGDSGAYLPACAEEEVILRQYEKEYDIKKDLEAMLLSLLAGEEGFEPPWTVLETGILPLDDSPRCCKTTTCASIANSV